MATNLQISFEDGSQLPVKLEGGRAILDQPVDIAMLGGHRFHVLVNGKSHDVELVERVAGEPKKLKLKIDNKVQVVSVKSETDLMLEKMGLGTRKAAGLKELKAPMPGLVVTVLVAEGQAVQAGEPILILEAMKMENMLKAQADVTIGKILVEKAQKVEKGQVMISFA
jgi:biotin carboxyl carrier protein